MNYLEVLKQAIPCNCGKSKLIINKDTQLNEVKLQIMCWSCDRKGPLEKSIEEALNKWNIDMDTLKGV